MILFREKKRLHKKFKYKRFSYFVSCLLIILGSMVPGYGSKPEGSGVDEGLNLLYKGKSKEALALFEKPIQAGDERALFYAAIIHLFGDHPQIEKGMPLLEKAVHKGYGPALDTYAGLFLHGEFVPQDSHKALMYYEMSAQRGYGPSQFNCGILYKNGEKVPKDLDKAFYYLTLAAQNTEDLDELADDAAEFRNDVAGSMSQDQYQQALSRIGSRVIPSTLSKKAKGKS